MSVHVAILAPPYDRLILDGTKRIESRFTKIDCPPFGCIRPGERIFFKRSGGAFFATAVASRVLMVDELTPARVDELVDRYNEWICGTKAYWKQRRKAVRYATLIWLRDVAPSSYRPPYKPQNMRAWYVLDDNAVAREDMPTAKPAIELELTAGCLRQHYVLLGEHKDRFAGEVTLTLDDGTTVDTRVVNGRFRWRGWRHWFEAHDLRPGDHLALTEAGRNAFDVSVAPRRRK